MAYPKTTWVDRAVQFANRFTKTNESSSSVDLTPNAGTVTQAGTPISAANLNKLEQGVQDAHTTADAALPKAGGTMTGNLVITNADPFLEIDDTNGTVPNDKVRYVVDGNTGHTYISVYNSSGSWIRDVLRIPLDGTTPNVTGGTLWHSGNLPNPLDKSGDSMTGDLGLGGRKLFDTTYGTNEFSKGNGDAASYTQHNMKLKGWWGLGMYDHTDTCRAYFDYRLGKWDVKDGYYVDGVKMAQTRTTNGYVEWNNAGTWQGVGGVKSIQRGTASVSGGNTVNVTISSIDMNKSVVILPQVSDNNNSTFDYGVGASLTSSTNLQFVAVGSRANVNIAWQVVEYY